MPKKRTRITLTVSQTASTDGQELIKRILGACHDGQLTITEVEELHVFLRRADASIPAMPFLRAITRSIVADGHIDDAEAYSLKCGFERVVPKEVRGVVSTHLESIGLPCLVEDAPAWINHPATTKQIAYIIDLGGRATHGMTKGEASKLIDALLTRRPPTARQIMVLRFFDQLKLSSSTKDDVSEWMDDLFNRSPQHELAWQRFKTETNHDPDCQDPTVVPIGAFRHYLRPSARDRAAKSSDSTSFWGWLLAWFR